MTTADKAETNHPPATVLVADDDATVLTLTCRLLASWGYQILPARNGPEALTLAESSATPVSLLVTDIEMPQMTGISLWKNMVRQFPSVQVVFMSGNTRSADVDGAAFVAKPFVPADLRRAVERALRISSPSAGL